MLKLEAWRYYLRARLALLIRQRRRAIENYRFALHFDPGFLRAAHGLAFLLAQDGDLAQARAQLQGLVQQQPNNGHAWFNLGFVHDHLQQPHEAIAAFTEAVRVDPKLDRAWYGMGLCHQRLGEHDAAARALEEAARLQPMNPHAWYELGMAYHALARGDEVKRAVEHLNRFDRKMTRQLIRDTGRGDLAHLVADLKV